MQQLWNKQEWCLLCYKDGQRGVELGWHFAGTAASSEIEVWALADAGAAPNTGIQHQAASKLQVLLLSHPGMEGSNVGLMGRLMLELVATTAELLLLYLMCPPVVVTSGVEVPTVTAPDTGTPGNDVCTAAAAPAAAAAAALCCGVCIGS